MCEGRAESRRRCGRVSPVPAQPWFLTAGILDELENTRSLLRETGSRSAASASGLGPPLPHLHQDRARPRHICTGTGPATSAPGLGSAVPHLHRDRAHPCHICAGIGPTPATSAPGLGPPLPRLHRDWAHPSHVCTGTGPTPATSAPGLRSCAFTAQGDRGGVARRGARAGISCAAGASCGGGGGGGGTRATRHDWSPARPR